MMYQKTYTNKKSLLLLLSIFLSMVTLSPFFPSSVVLAQETPTFVDKSRIQFQGVEYLDRDIYDTENNYIAHPDSTPPRGCREMSVVGELRQDRVALALEECTEGGETFLVDCGDCLVNSYRVSDSVIFLPERFYKFNRHTGADDCYCSTYYMRIPAEHPQYEEYKTGAATYGGDFDQKYFEIKDDGEPDFGDYLLDNKAWHGGSELFDLFYKNNGAPASVPYYAPDPPPGVEVPGRNSTPPPWVQDSEEETEPTCESGFDNPMSWLVCAVLGFIDNGLDALERQVFSLLTVGSSDYGDPKLREAWGYFRNIASLLLVVIGLVMVVGQAVGKD